MNPTPNSKIKVKRVPKRGVYDKETIYRILDKDFVCQLGFVYEGYPVVIPTIYGRKDDKLYFHGASTSRMLVNLEKGIDVCFSMMQVNGIVLARSAFHHSLNYESVVVFGKATLISDASEKMAALAVVSDQILKHRWEEARLPNAKEMKATKVLELTISEASAKVRIGPPGDDKPDYELDIWAGVLPIERHFGQPIADPVLRAGIEVPKSVKEALNPKP